MGRRPRDYHPSFIYHLTTHGVDDRPIFCDDVDRQDLVRRLLRISGRDGWEWHAACLMDTHYHLLIRPTLGRVSAGMRDLNSAYCRAFNKRHGRRGALLEARYGEKTIRDEQHLPAAAQYIELNPVAAGMVEKPEDWPWSTYGDNAFRRALMPRKV
jgi:putative transposase